MRTWELTILDGAPPVGALASLAAGDIDGDGHNEIVTGGGGALLWYRPDTFEKGAIAQGDFGVGLALVDLDGDGKLEVIASDQVGRKSEQTLLWFKPQPDLNGCAARHAIDPAADGSAHDIVVVDIDGDGELEIVANSAYSSRPGVFIYKRGADVTAPWSKHEVTRGIFSEGLSIGDLDGDGRLEIVHGPDWFHSPTAGSLSGPWRRSVYAPSFREMCRTALVDVTGNGRPDIVICESEYPDGRMSWFENHFAESPAAPLREHPLDPPDAPVNFAHSLWARRDGGGATVFVAEMAAGGWHQPYNWNARLIEFETRDNGATWRREVMCRGAGTHQAFLFDIDRDGALEVVGKEWGLERKMPRVHTWKRRAAASAGAAGVGRAFPEFKHRFIDRDKPDVAVDILPVDVDGDGLVDVVCGAWWYHNPTWERRTIPGIAQALNACDIDGDGKPELIAMKAQPGKQGNKALSSELCWFKPLDALRGEWAEYPIGKGDEKEWPHSTAIAPLLPGGRLALAAGYHGAQKGGHPPHLFEIPADPKQGPWTRRVLAEIEYGEEIVPFDLDGDGLIDLVAGPYWLRNRGDGTFAATQLADVPGVARVRVADVNGDGRPDIVFVVEDVDYKASVAAFVAVGWLENPGRFDAMSWPVHTIDKVRSPHSLDVADVDGDGEAELIVGEHDPFAPYRSRSRLLIYKKADPRGRAWKQFVIDDRFEHHDGTKVFEVAPGRIGIVSHGWKDSKYVHLWERAE